jgi:hypothetical protein
VVECCAGQGQALAEGGGGVVTESLGIRHGHQKEREGTGRRAELIDIALTDEALLHPAEWFGDLAELVERARAFVPREGRLGEGVHVRK